MIRQRRSALVAIGSSLLLLSHTPGLADDGPIPQPFNRPVECLSNGADQMGVAPPCPAHIEPMLVGQTPPVLVEPEPIMKPRPIVRQRIAPELLAFLREIRLRIAEARDYPPNAITLGLQGTTTVKLTLQPDGHVHQVRIRKSSGHGMLDEAALDAVRKVLPLKPPPEAGNRPLELDIPISFALR